MCKVLAHPVQSPIVSSKRWVRGLRFAHGLAQIAENLVIVKEFYFGKTRQWFGHIPPALGQPPR
jgi:hypothetical protein